MRPFCRATNALDLRLYCCLRRVISVDAQAFQIILAFLAARVLEVAGFGAQVRYPPRPASFMSMSNRRVVEQRRRLPTAWLRGNGTWSQATEAGKATRRGCALALATVLRSRMNARSPLPERASPPEHQHQSVNMQALGDIGPRQEMSVSDVAQLIAACDGRAAAALGRFVSFPPFWRARQRRPMPRPDWALLPLAWSPNRPS